MTPPDMPTEDEKLEAALASPLFVDAFLAALQDDEDDEAVYGWVSETREPNVSDRDLDEQCSSSGAQI